jgi:hypothetical protein
MNEVDGVDAVDVDEVGGGATTSIKSTPSMKSIHR